MIAASRVVFSSRLNNHDEKIRQESMINTLAFIEMMLAQSALQQSGYYHGPVDGNLSKSARQALMGFQKDDGLEVTGELDDELLRRLMALRQRGRMPLMLFNELDPKPKGRKCFAMQGLVEEIMGAICQAIPKAAYTQ
jgi:peptidoglycan hydrolase-like protein with peptidoglycan-binding domain